MSTYTSNRAAEYAEAGWPAWAIPEAAPLHTFKRLGILEENMVTESRAEYCRVLNEASALVKRASMVCNSRSEFITYVSGVAEADGFYLDLCLAMLDGEHEDTQKIAWELVQENISDVLWKLFPDETNDEDDFSGCFNVAPIEFGFDGPVL